MQCSFYMRRFFFWPSILQAYDSILIVLPSRHITYKQRRIDVDTAFFRRHVFGERGDERTLVI